MEKEGFDARAALSLIYFVLIVVGIVVLAQWGLLELLSGIATVLMIVFYVWKVRSSESGGGSSRRGEPEEPSGYRYDPDDSDDCDE